MRQNWMEIVEIPPTGGLDEFDRKEVRNDYPLMALWEMGVKKVRVPLRDLLVPDNIDRMRMLKAHGHEFTLFSFGNPAPHLRNLITAHQDIFSAWEIGLNWEVLERDIGGVGEMAQAVEMPVYLSRLRHVPEPHRPVIGPRGDLWKALWISEKNPIKPRIIMVLSETSVRRGK